MIRKVERDVGPCKDEKLFIFPSSLSPKCRYLSVYKHDRGAKSGGVKIRAILNPTAEIPSQIVIAGSSSADIIILLRRLFSLVRSQHNPKTCLQ
jgi:hypothetical protein